MSRFQAILASLLLAVPAWAQQANEPRRIDLFGDPLPPGALRRLGTVRFRQSSVVHIAFLADRESLVAQGIGRTVQWNVATGKPVRTIPYRSSGLSQDGGLVAVHPDERSFAVLDVSTGKEIFRQNELGDKSEYCCSAISPDKLLVAVGTMEETSIWDLRTGERRAKIPGTRRLTFSPDGKWLSCQFHDQDDKAVALFDPITGRERGRINPPGPQRYFREYDFTPDGQLLLASCPRHGILLYDVKSLKVVRRLDTDAKLLAISPDSKVLATGKKRTVMLTNIEVGTEIRRWQVDDDFMEQNQGRGAFSPDGKILALGYECGIQLWNPETGKRLDPFRTPIHFPERIAVSDDAKTIAVVFREPDGGSLRLFDAETLREKSQILTNGFASEDLTFSPDGRILAFNERRLDSVTNSGRVRLIDVLTGKDIKAGKEVVGCFSHWAGNGVLVAIENSRDENRPEFCVSPPYLRGD